MEIRPYKLIATSELALITKRLSALWMDWCGHWLPGVKPESPLCLPADDPRNDCNRIGQQWRRFALAQAGGLSIALDDMLPTRLAALAWGGCVPKVEASAGGPSRLLTDLMYSMLDDLAVRLFKSAGEPITSPAQLEHNSSEPQPRLWQRGSGAVCSVVMIGGMPLHTLLEEPIVSALTRELPVPESAREPLVPRRVSVGAQRVRLELWAGETQVELGLLQSLAPGDVILLDLEISEPLRLTINGQQTGHPAYLGRSGERKAVQLLPSNRS